MENHLKSYIRIFLDYAGRRALTIPGLVLLGALLEGLGVLMLIPFITILTRPEVAGGESGGRLLGIVRQAFSALGLEQGTTGLLAVLGLFVAVAVLRALVLWRRDMSVAALSLGFIDHMRARLFRSLAAAPWATVSTLRHSQVQHVITNDIARISQGSHFMIRGSVALLMLIVQLAVALVLSARLTVLVLAFLGVSMWLLRPLQAKAHKLGKELTRVGEAVYDVLGSFMAGLKLSKTTNAETRFVDEFERNVDALRASQIQFTREQSGARVLFQTSGYIVACAVVALGLFVTKTPLPVLVALLVILSRLTGPFLSLQQGIQSVANMLPAYQGYEALRERLDRSKPEAVRPGLHGATPLPFGPMAGAPTIALEDISFRHTANGSCPPVLDKLSLTIAPGEMLALVGASGAGKTTLADILVGLLHPAEGLILVNDLPLTQENLPRWREAVAYVPQDPFLFDRSIRANLAWIAPEAGESELWQALKAAGVDKLVQSLSQGLDTRVGDRGQRLSGGERQRICLARALLRRPRLMILDEATNALDIESERRFLDTIGDLKSKMSVIVVSHRLTSLRNMDRIVVMAEGRIVESGSWGELMAVPGGHFAGLLNGAQA